jgi:hypothetical protein
MYNRLSELDSLLHTEEKGRKNKKRANVSEEWYSLNAVGKSPLALFKYDTFR